MKSYGEPIDVTLGDDGLPRCLHWRRRLWHVLRILDRWVLQSRWWAREERRLYLLLEARPEPPGSPDEGTSTFEIYGAGANHWVLARLLD